MLRLPSVHGVSISCDQETGSLLGFAGVVILLVLQL